jgi:hypothetical protein
LQIQRVPPYRKALRVMERLAKSDGLGSQQQEQLVHVRVKVRHEEKSFCLSLSFLSQKCCDC